jgi:hypothetical protein
MLVQRVILSGESPSSLKQDIKGITDSFFSACLAHHTALLAGRANAVVLADIDGRTTALLAGRANAVVLADGRTTALLAGRAKAVVLADGRTTALLACR